MNEWILLVLVGLPRSGKSTYARGLLAKYNGWAIVNPDAIRLSVHGERYIAKAEPYVWATAYAMPEALFRAGHSHVIIDATNTTRRRRDAWTRGPWQTGFHYINTDAATCIERAKEQPDLIPVIERMAENFEPLEADEIYEITYGES